MTGFGDKLARGAASASYATTDKKITDEKWKSMFEGWDIVKFLEGENEESGGDARVSPSRNSGAKS